MYVLILSITNNNNTNNITIIHYSYLVFPSLPQRKRDKPQPLAQLFDNNHAETVSVYSVLQLNNEGMVRIIWGCGGMGK